MSPTPAEKITHPAQLWLPARLERANELFASLTPSGQAQFISEFVQALYEARRTDNLRPLQDVVEAWYRTLVARRSPDYEAGIAWARDHEPSSDDLVDVQELRERMGIYLPACRRHTSSGTPLQDSSTSSAMPRSAFS
jgi:hypothetical protein